jgi:predicted metalloprotease with PDZ domain
MLPLVRERHRWISEGFASYYQNVLMSRAGRYTEREAWTKLHEGFERGRASRPELSPNNAAAQGVRQARMKIYWSGAAIALLADIELRERSGGRESLDTALDRLQKCCLPSERTWSGTELFTKLDSLVDGPVFMPLYRRHANNTGFPNLRPVFERLGVDIEDDKVRIHRGAELAHIRDAITEPTL